MKSYLHDHEIQVIIDNLRSKLVNNCIADGEEGRVNKLRQLRNVVSNCTACGDNVCSKPYGIEWNAVDPDMVIVNDTALSQAYRVDILVEALKQAGFSSSRIAATAVTRCDISQDGDVKAVYSNCVSRFLFRELQLLKPKLILSLGSFASSALLQREVKVSEEGGNIQWTGPWAIMPCPSPGWAYKSAARQETLQLSINKAYNFIYGK